jgi:hypothetical protein
MVSIKDIVFIKKGKIKMFKKMFAVLGIAFCLQAAQSMDDCDMSGICTCQNWPEMSQKIERELSQANNPLVIFDCDGIMLNRVGMECNITDPALLGVLERLKASGVPFLCMTSMASIEWATRRQDFELAGIAPFFTEVPLFNRDWEPEGRDKAKRYFVDTGRNTVYTARPKGYEHTEEKPLNFYALNPEDYHAMYRYKIYQKRLRDEAMGTYLVQAKGSVFARLIEDGFIPQPGTVIFVDDTMTHLRDMRDCCRHNGISFLGLWCEGYVKSN